MNIQIAKTAGYCFGVRNAVDIAEKCARESEGRILYTYGPLIHNTSVVRSLEEKGVKSIDSLDDLKEGDTVIIRAHGVGEETYRQIAEKRAKVVDATCPNVRKIHKIVREQEDAGRSILILGDPEHPEVKGIRGWCRGECRVIGSEEELEGLALSKDAAYSLVAQTTFNQYKFLKIVENLKKMEYNINVFPTICKATQDHQREAVALSGQADVMIIIGGKHSSNTRKLYELCKEHCPRTYLVEDASDPLLGRIRSEMREDCSIAITAGASTPNYIMQEVKDKMSENMNSFEELFNESFRGVHARDIVKGTVVQVTDAEIVFNIGYKCDGTMTKEEFGGTDAPLTEQVKEGDEMDVMVVKVSDSEVTLSRRRLLQNRAYGELDESLNEKKVLSGVVQEAFENGITVMYKGIRVFIPASLVDIRRVPDLKTLVGQEIQFRVIRLQLRRRRVLGDRRSVLAEENAKKREETLKNLQIGSRVMGTVKTITNYCAFVDLGGIDGMLHISEMGWSMVRHPNQVLKEGQQIEVMVKDMDLEKNRISLTTKFPETNPWNGVEEEFAVGSIVEGKVVRFADFGAFVELKKGVDGLIHISHLSRKFVKQPSDVLKIGETVRAKVIDLNLEQKRISLSLRDMENEEVTEYLEEVIDEDELAGEEIPEEASSSETEALSYETESSSSETEIPSSETETSTSETEASPSETEIPSSETEPSPSETEIPSSEIEISSSETEASTSEK